MVIWRGVFISAVLFLSACGGDGSMIFDRNTVSNFWEKIHPLKYNYATKIHFPNDSVLSLEKCRAWDATTVCLPKQAVVKDESCTQCTMNIVVTPLMCSRPDVGTYECKMRSIIRDSSRTPTCFVEGKDVPPVIIDCPVSYE